MRTYTIVVEPDQDGGYFVTVPALPGCFTRGSTIEQCRERAVEAIEVHISGLQADASPSLRKSGHRNFWPSPSQPDLKAPGSTSKSQSDPTRWAFSTAPRVRALRVASPHPPGMMRRNHMAAAS